jgi:hypothetical protein
VPCTGAAHGTHDVVVEHQQLSRALEQMQPLVVQLDGAALAADDDSLAKQPFEPLHLK